MRCRGCNLKQGAHSARAYLSASCWRASGKDAMPAKVRRQWVEMTVAGSVGAASLGSTSRHRCSRRPRASNPPERVSSPPFSSEETHVSQHSSTAACTIMVEIAGLPGLGLSLLSLFRTADTPCQTLRNEPDEKGDQHLTHDTAVSGLIAEKVSEVAA